MLHLHTYILNSVFKSDNKSMVQGEVDEESPACPQDNSAWEGRSAPGTEDQCTCRGTHTKVKALGLACEAMEPEGNGMWLTSRLVSQERGKKG